MKNWKLESREVETGQDQYIFTGECLNPPIILSDYGKHYKCTEFYAKDNTLLWLICERSLDNGTTIKANLTPGEIARMDLGFSDDNELHWWIGLARGLQ